MESDMYDQNTITEAVHTKWAGKTVHFVKETDSTNEWAKQLSRQGAPHGTLAAAEFQSAGKGRLGRIASTSLRIFSLVSGRMRSVSSLLITRDTKATETPHASAISFIVFFKATSALFAGGISNMICRRQNSLIFSFYVRLSRSPLRPLPQRQLRRY